MTDDHDAQLRMRLPQAIRDGDPFLVAGWRHADVREDDVRVLGLDRREQLIPIVARGDELQPGRAGEHVRDGFADEVAVVRQHDAEGARIGHD